MKSASLPTASTACPERFSDTAHRKNCLKLNVTVSILHDQLRSTTLCYVFDNYCNLLLQFAALKNSISEKERIDLKTVGWNIIEL